MSRLNAIVKELEEKYTFDINDLLDLYKRGMSRREVSERLGLSVFSTRQIFERLALSPKKKQRAETYLKFWVEYGAGEANLQEELDAPVKENKYLHKKLGVAERALQRSRDEANHLRGIIRKDVRKDSLQEQVVDLVEQALPIKDKRDFNVVVNTVGANYDEHVSCLLLSDLHAEEAVTKKDIGNNNEYNWEIMESRLDTLFGEWFNEYRGESKGVVVMAGDFISGIIHDQLESTTKPTAEAVHDLADILSGYMKSASVIFETVEIVHIGGNHERISERIKSSQKGFDFSYLFAQILRAKLSDTENISLEISTNGYITFEAGEKVVGVHHGDLHRGPVHQEHRTFKVYEAFEKTLGTKIDHVIQGHTHQFGYCNTHKGACIVNGSLIGSNAYGHTNGFIALRPSQTIVQFSPDGEVETVKQVFLD